MATNDQMKVDSANASRRSRTADEATAGDSSSGGEAPNATRHKGEPNLTELFAKFSAEQAANALAAAAASDAKFAQLFAMLNTKADASAEATVKQFDSLKYTLADHAEKIASLMESRASETDAAASSGWPAAGSAGPAPAARPLRLPHFGKGVPIRPRPARGQDEDGRFKVFFTNFPGLVPKLVLNSWIDRIYEKTDKEPGFQKHIGHNKSFAISFPDKEGAFQFIQQVTDNKVSLNFSCKSGDFPITMKPQRRTSLYGKAIGTVWQLIADHLKSESSIDNPVEIDTNTNSGLIYALVGGEVRILFSIAGEKLVPDEVNLNSVNFPASLTAKVFETFVA
jgi:hypothetical protein